MEEEQNEEVIASGGVYKFDFSYPLLASGFEKAAKAVHFLVAVVREISAG